MKFELNQLIASCLFITSLTANEIPPAEQPLNIMLSSTVGGRSHIKYLMEVSKPLRDRGHTITYAAPKGNHKFNDPYGYNIYNLGESIVDSQKSMQETDIDDILRKGIDFMPSLFDKVIDLNYEFYFTKYEKLFTTEKIDLIVCDFFAGPCHDAARKHSIPLMVGFQGLGLGVGEAPYITNSMDNSPTTTENLSFLQRFKASVIDQIVFIYKFMPLSRIANEKRKKYGVPANNNPWGDFDRVMKIDNTYLGIDDSRPIDSSLKLIGPIIDTDIPELDSELKAFLDEHRTMYMAFGSHTALNNRLLTALLEAAQMSIDNGSIDGVLWGLANTDSEKFPKSYTVNGVTYTTSDILNGLHPKIKILKWAPQISILNHPNTKLFLSHGGLESLHEAVNFGTPILVMPGFGDQPRNSRLVKNRGIGDFVTTLTTNSADLFSKIKELTRPDNAILQSKVKHLQSINKFNNGKRLENALFIEHYANSAKICRQYQTPKAFEIPCELEPYMQADTRMSYFAAYKIDILLALASIGFIFIAVTLVGVFKIVKIVLSKSLVGKKLKDE
ncbi:glycosyltransferase family 1 protein [Conidiobolus coronatus NRRL 28638]|uniref:Glycosyltransferase family 1 protein n=1 Tax=Conidiobolus coronatus (strain ATCC 28846 / CBS 209.66 / NRRL 28638) TaxID=796925 RepID=A0A137NY20_CONC2|nr:glycosyltransferase family 1 protein [Conidiobolus coronatus NRRL 28638]|eukprot:KXN67770.1 glycosyltransferase family 1 protein [Conidiobolus coronatus NRRL 28638]